MKTVKITEYYNGYTIKVDGVTAAMNGLDEPSKLKAILHAAGLEVEYDEVANNIPRGETPRHERDYLREIYD